MGARPAGPQWAPLGLDSDPVPGDPDQIRQEQSHLAKVATQISNQVNVLRQISNSNDEVGAHADKIREKAGDLAGDLDKVVGRYQKVSSALNGWIPELEQAQQMSLQALNQAEGPHQQLNQTVALPSGNNLTPQQKQAVTDYHNSMNKAQGELDAAKRLLDKATGLRDTQGSYYAGQIKSACDDGMKDSWWDKFKNFISQYAGIIKDICTVLEAIATILAIVALFIPGLDIIVILGIAATALALIGRTMLAATGNGSWIDVALDAFALLTFGTGKIIGKAMEGAFDSIKEASATARLAEIADSPVGQFATKLSELADGMKNSGVVKGTIGVLDKIGLKGLSKLADSGVAKISEGLIGKSEAIIEHNFPTVAKVLEGVSEDVKPVEVFLHGGEKDSVLLTRNIAALGDHYMSPEIVDQIAQFNHLLNLQRGTFALTNITDIPEKLANGFQWYGTDGEHPIVNAQFTDGWTNFKDQVVTENGFSTSTADKIVDISSVVAPPVGLPAQGFRFAVGKWG